jgi:hypothetical protein
LLAVAVAGLVGAVAVAVAEVFVLLQVLVFLLARHTL